MAIIKLYKRLKIIAVATCINESGVRSLKLETKFSIPKFSEIEWKPLNFIDVSDEDSAKVLIKLLETLEDLDDVQSVSSNFNINDSLMDKII